MDGAKVTGGTPDRRSTAVDAFTGSTIYPLAVVTTIAGDGERAGCVAGFVTQCSIDPSRFLICVSRANHTFGVVTRAAVVAVHLLGREQTDIASLFGEATGDTIDKFAAVAWHPGPRGVPLLDSCSAWLALGISGHLDVGDHLALLTYPLDGGPGTCDGVLTNREAPDLKPGHPVG